MKRISAFFLLLISGICFSQANDRIIISQTDCQQVAVNPVSLKNGLTGKVTGLNIEKNDSGVFGSKTWRCSSIRSLPESNQPMLLIDGVPAKLSFLSEINPDDIEDVTICNKAKATGIFGSDGVNGAIWIITKAAKLHKFIIKDFLDGSPIAGATILFTSVENRNEKFQFVANDSGMVVTNKLNRVGRYQMIVSSVGHITFQQVFENRVDLKREEIFLVREIKTCEEVIVVAGHGFGCCLACGYTTHRQEGSGTTIITRVDKEKQATVAPFEFKVYPNPLPKGRLINFQFNNNDGKERTIRVISLDGRCLLQQTISANQGKNVFELPADPRWAAGIYFVQLLYENGQVAASEKIILQ